MEILRSEVVWYGALQLGVMAAFGVAAVRAWRHSRARFVELIAAFLFGLLLEGPQPRECVGVPAEVGNVAHRLMARLSQTEVTFMPTLS